MQNSIISDKMSSDSYISISSTEVHKSEVRQNLPTIIFKILYYFLFFKFIIQQYITPQGIYTH